MSWRKIAGTLGIPMSTVILLRLDPSSLASTRVRPAHSVLTHAARAIEIEDIEVRVSELERAAEGPKEYPSTW
jgi:hypothetical protein